MYVLKDVFDFDRLLREKEAYQYGKQLKFLHMQEAFVPECIYFRGTAEQWAKVRLNEYAARWQGVTVIFLGDAA